LERACTHWKVERLAAVDRNVLRIAAFELLCEDGTPPEVVIDEAVEVARRFAGDASPGFVNGVLDALVREQGVAAT
jgi:N utilization substance protein B